MLTVLVQLSLIAMIKTASVSQPQNIFTKRYHLAEILEEFMDE